MMNLETKEQLILAKAIDAFQRTTGLQIDHVWQEGPVDALWTGVGALSPRASVCLATSSW